MENKTCETCKHFRQHYVRRGFWYMRTNSGHCVYPRRKMRRPADTCPHWAVRAD